MAPKTVFKYEPMTFRSLQNLKAQSVYFGSPKNFNDPYDCAMSVAVEDPTDQDLEAARTYYQNLPSTPSSLKSQLPTMSIGDLRKQFVSGVKNSVETVCSEFLNKMGVTCFAQDNDNLLMWSHYAAQHSGFCLEFSTDFEPFNELREVQYSDSMPVISFNDAIRNNHEQVLDLFSMKSMCWGYEQEWRALHSEAGTVFGYEAAALKAIYFGAKCSEQDRDLICLIVSLQNPNVDIYLGRRSETEFKVEFDGPRSYTPMTP